jgi:hypothetical protein
MKQVEKPILNFAKLIVLARLQIKHLHSILMWSIMVGKFQIQDLKNLEIALM